MALNRSTHSLPFFLELRPAKVGTFGVTLLVGIGLGGAAAGRLRTCATCLERGSVEQRCWVAAVLPAGRPNPDDTVFV